MREGLSVWLRRSWSCRGRKRRRLRDASVGIIAPRHERREKSERQKVKVKENGLEFRWPFSNLFNTLPCFFFFIFYLLLEEWWITFVTENTHVTLFAIPHISYFVRAPLFPSIDFSKDFKKFVSPPFHLKRYKIILSDSYDFRHSILEYVTHLLSPKFSQISYLKN